MADVAPRYLRFVTALLLGAAAATAPQLAGCGSSTTPNPPDPEPDPDAEIPDASTVVDGPLPPPDLPRARLA